MWLLLACVATDPEGDRPPRPPKDDTAADHGPDTADDTADDTGPDTGPDTADDTDPAPDLPSSGGSGGPVGLADGAAGSSTFRSYAPPCAVGPDASVVYTLHGSGGRAADMVAQWQALADRECFIVVGLDSSRSASWNFSTDVDNFAALYDQVDAAWDVAFRYLHGYSAGAHWTYIIGISNSELFSGLGVWAGSLAYAEEWGYWPDRTEAPIPVAIGHGTADTTVPYTEAQHALAELDGAGWPADLYAVPGGTHAYDPSSQEHAWSWWVSHR